MSIDSGTRRRLILGFLSGWVSKLGATIVQFVQVPFFLHYWSVPLYGEWMIVTAIPTYLGFSNIGFGNVAGNKMTMLAAQGDRNGALRVFQSTWWLIFSVVTAIAVVGSGLLYVIPVSEKLKLHEISAADARWIIGYLGIAILFGQLELLLQSAYRCIDRYAYGSFVKSSAALVAFGTMLIPVAMHAGPRTTALVYAASNIAVTLLFVVLVRRDIPWLRFGWRHASLAEVRSILGPAVAFMGFPMGNALNLQGMLLAVGVVVAMITVGPWFLSHWTGGHVPPSRPLLSLLLLVVVFYSLWSTSSTVMTATNNHQRLAAVYLAATGVTVGITWFAAQHLGLYGAAASLLLSETLMNLYVLPASLRLAQDTLPEFLLAMLRLPAALHPQALLRRLRRSKPALES